MLIDQATQRQRQFILTLPIDNVNVSIGRQQDLLDEPQDRLCFTGTRCADQKQVLVEQPFFQRNPPVRLADAGARRKSVSFDSGTKPHKARLGRNLR